MKEQQGDMHINTYQKTGHISPTEMKNLILTSLDMDKAENINCIPLADGSALADYMIFASGTSSRHVSALAKRVKEKLQEQGVKGIVTEGASQCDWVVMDAGDVIVHLFRPEVRDFYNIEKMWSSPGSLDVVESQIQA